MVRIHIKLIWIGNSDWTNGRYGVVCVEDCINFALILKVDKSGCIFEREQNTYEYFRKFSFFNFELFATYGSRVKNVKNFFSERSIFGLELGYFGKGKNGIKSENFMLI